MIVFSAVSGQAYRNYWLSDLPVTLEDPVALFAEAHPETRKHILAVKIVNREMEFFVAFYLKLVSWGRKCKHCQRPIPGAVNAYFMRCNEFAF